MRFDKEITSRMKTRADEEALREVVDEDVLRRLENRGGPALRPSAEMYGSGEREERIRLGALKAVQRLVRGQSTPLLTPTRHHPSRNYASMLNSILVVLLSELSPSDATTHLAPLVRSLGLWSPLSPRSTLDLGSLPGQGIREQHKRVLWATLNDLVRFQPGELFSLLTFFFLLPLLFPD